MKKINVLSSCDYLEHIQQTCQSAIRILRNMQYGEILHRVIEKHIIQTVTEHECSQGKAMTMSQPFLSNRSSTT